METESCVSHLQGFQAHINASHYCVDCHCLFCQPCSEFHTKKARHTTLDRRRLNCALCPFMINACAVCNKCTCYLCKECVNDHNLSHKSHSIQFLPWSTTIHSSLMSQSNGQVGSSESSKHANAKETHTGSVSKETDGGNSETDTAPLLPPIPDGKVPESTAVSTASNASEADKFKTNKSKPDVKQKQNVVKQKGPEKQITDTVPEDEYYEEIAETPISFKEISGLSVNTEGEESKCCIQTIAVLPKGEILLYDDKNNKLKLFDTDFMLKSSADISYTIKDMCLCETKDGILVFATAPHLKSVIRFKINESLYCNEAILLDVSCTGITSCQKGIAVSVQIDKKVSELQVFDFDGKLVTNVSREINRKPILGAMFGKSLKMKTVSSLSVIKDGSQVIILDSSKSSVTNVDITTNTVEFCYKDQELKEPTSVATDYCKQIYVLGHTSRNIHVLSARGQKLRVFLMEIELLAMNYYVVGAILLLSRPSSKKIKRYEIIRSVKE